MRVGLLGGSFDPIHLGHLALARAARVDLDLERVLLLPTARPPHKPDRELTPILARYAMAELASLDEPDLWVSTLELDGRRPAYTIETLERLRSAAPGDEHVLLVGADSLAELDQWRRWSELLAGWEIGVLARPGSEWREVEPRLAPELRRGLETARLRWIEAPTHAASSTEIRRRLAAGEPLPAGWLDPRVLSFVEKYRLYR